MMNRVDRFAVLAMAFVVAFGAACAKPDAPSKPPVPVTVAIASVGAAPYIVQANGIVEPKQTVAVQAQVGGVLTSVLFKEGDEVKQGQMLFTIDAVPYRAALQQAQAVLARDVAQWENANRDAQRYAALAQKDFVTRSQADQAASNAAALKAVLDADRANVASAQFNLNNATVRAPVSGKTGSIQVRQGNLARTGTNTPLVVINQIHPILVRFAVPERELAQVQEYARKGSIKARAMPGSAAGNVAGSAPGRTVEGALSFVDNGVDTTTGNVTLKAQFENQDNLLWPGQFVPVQLELFVQQDAMLIPTQAIQTGQEGTFVFVIDDKNKAQMQPVTVGRAAGDMSVITKGLTAGTKVVVDGQSRLTVGATVDIKVPGAAGAANPTAAGGESKQQGAAKQ
jgi:multidrug efflux system membrane fusion protein